MIRVIMCDQVVRDIAALVGCGFKQCPRHYANGAGTYLAGLYICNYAYGYVINVII